MRNQEIFSKEWCRLVFDGRNRRYGAYVLRRDAGRRYARALLIVAAAVALAVSVPVGMGLYVRHVLAKDIEELTEFARLKPKDAEEGHELKAISAGRRVTPGSSPDASDELPEIVDDLVAPRPMGINGPAVLTDEDLQQLTDADTLHNIDRTDLPPEGVQLTPTEVVEQMPEFPGGTGALMKWLDAHVVYPKHCVDDGIEGDVEVSFLVDATGTVREPAVTRTLHPDLDRAALSAIRRMPRWKPGRSGGAVTIVQVTVPIHFQVH